MVDKFTIRDILVYSIIGLTAFVVYFFHNLDSLKSIVIETKDYSDLTILIFIPITYLIGHIIMGIDDIFFNHFLFIPLRNRTIPSSNKFWKYYNYLFFGNRNLGIRKSNNIDDKEFLETCKKLLKLKEYDKPEYYQILSDLFKGILLITIISLIFSKTLEIKFLHFIVAIIIWYRGRMFSVYYVKFINNEITSSIS